MRGGISRSISSFNDNSKKRYSTKSYPPPQVHVKAGDSSSDKHVEIQFGCQIRKPISSSDNLKGYCLQGKVHVRGWSHILCLGRKRVQKNIQNGSGLKKLLSRCITFYSPEHISLFVYYSLLRGANALFVLPC